MEIKKTECAEEISYVEFESNGFTLTFYGKDSCDDFDIDISDGDGNFGTSIWLRKAELQGLVDFLQNELNKAS